MPPALQTANPDQLSSGLFGSLDAAGAFGGVPAVPSLRAGPADLAKGRPLAVLDARVGVNTRLGDDPPALLSTQRGQAEPHLVRSAANPEVLLATFQEGRFSADGGALGDGYAVSRDGGLTWTRDLIPGLTRASGGTYFRATDPVAGAGPQGELYLNALASIDNAFGLAAVTVSRSLDSGATWSAPVVVFQSPNSQVAPDKNWMAVNDLPGAPNSGRIVVTWTNFTSTANGVATGNHLVSALSEDRGQTWSQPALITPVGSSNQGTQPAFLPDGSLLVVYITFLNRSSTDTFSIDCKRSLDGGRTYPGTATSVVPLVLTWNDPQLRHGSFLPSVAVARQTGDIFVTYVGRVGGSPRVMVTKSTNAGASWSAPQPVSDQPAGISVVNPAIAVSPDGRSISVVFIDKRRAPDGQNFIDHYAALSVDGGTTWQPNLRLTEISSDLRYGTLTSRGYMLGDYLGLAGPFRADQPFVALWCDTRTGDSDPEIVRFMGAPTANFAAWRQARGLVGDNPLADTDGDGATDYLEYLQGTDPRKVESGEDVAVRLASTATVEAVWTERANLESSGGSVTITAPSTSASGNPVTFTTSPLAASELPTTTVPAEGLVWRGARANVSAGVPLAITRSYQPPNSANPSLGDTIAFANTDARLINLSARGQLLTGAGQLIGSLVTKGAERQILLRGVGPTLAQFAPGLAVASDPVLIFSTAAGADVVSNDDWSAGSPANAAALTTTAAAAGGFPLVSDQDAAVLLTRSNGAYSALVTNKSPTGRIGLVEIYDVSKSGDGQLANLSARGEVGPGDDALIAGVVIRGTQPRRILLRAVGPSLARFQVGATTLPDPILQLFRGATLIASNDDWEISRSAAAAAATGERLGAFPLDRGSLDAVLLLSLTPGSYTAVVSDASGARGIALVEIYDAD